MPESNWIMQLLYSRLMKKFIYNQYEIASVKRSVTDKQLDYLFNHMFFHIKGEFVIR